MRDKNWFEISGFLKNQAFERLSVKLQCQLKQIQGKRAMVRKIETFSLYQLSVWYYSSIV